MHTFKNNSNTYVLRKILRYISNCIVDCHIALIRNRLRRSFDLCFQTGSIGREKIITPSPMTYIYMKFTTICDNSYIITVTSHDYHGVSNHRCSGAHQRKHQSSSSLASMRMGGQPVTGRLGQGTSNADMFQFNDVITYIGSYHIILSSFAES